MFNLCGSFGPWHMDIGGDDSVGSRWGSMLNSGFEQRFLSGAAFHVRLSTPSSTTVDTLATEDTLASWNPIQPGQGVYSALFPKAWFEYDLSLPVALKQVTPFVARDEYRSSLPAGIFELAVDNPTGENVEVACMFSFPNAIYRLPTTQYTYTRTGLRSQAVRGSGTAGVRLQAQDPANVPETQRTEWVIAAKGPSGSTLSTTEDWAADGDGSDLYSVFSALGELPNRAIDPRRRALGGAVAVSFSLAPYERKAATFVLAWDFPVVQFRNPVDGTRWWKRYTQWYPGHYRAWDIASDVLAGSSRHRAGDRRLVEEGERQRQIPIVAALCGTERALLRRLRRRLLGERVHHQAQALRRKTGATSLLHPRDRRGTATARASTSATTRRVICCSCSRRSSRTCCSDGPTW